MAGGKNRSVTTDLNSLIRSLQPAALYTISSKTIFLQGFNRYKKSQLKTFTWGENRRELKAILFDLSVISVDFSVKKNRLSHICSCSKWTEVKQCEHVICSLLTLVNLFSPKHFQISDPDPRRMKNLREALLRDGNQALDSKKKSGARSKSEAPPQIELVINIRASEPSVTLRWNGSVIDSPIGLPEKLRAFTSRYSSDDDLKYQFYAYLGLNAPESSPPLELLSPKRLETTETETAPLLILEHDSGRLALRWNPDQSYIAKTELTVSEEKVGIQALTLLEDRLCSAHILFWDFVVDPESGAFSRLEHTEGWGVYHHLDRLFRPSSPYGATFDSLDETRLSGREWIIPNQHFQVPLDIFRAIQLNITESSLQKTLEDLVFKVKQDTVQTRIGKHSYRLNLVSEQEEISILRAECMLDETSALPTAHSFEFFTAIWENNQPAPIKAKKRLTVLYQTFFHLFHLKNKDDATTVIRQALANGDFTQNSIKRAARDLLKTYFSSLKQEDLRLQVHDMNWFVVANEKEKEVLLYEIPFEVFGPKAFKDMTRYNEMRIPTQQYYSLLPELYAKCQSAGITLYYKGEPVQSSKWEFSFDARRASGLNWFEIKPEIRTDGKKIDEATWRKLLTQQGVVEKDGALHILDDAARKIIKSLALIAKPQSEKARSKREIVQVPRLQILDWVALRKEGVDVLLSEEDEALIQRLTELETIEPTTTPRNLIAKLRPYQKQGLDWLVFLYRHRLGGILADDMGLGKTLQAISFLAAIHEKIVPPVSNEARVHLVVVPPTLLFNWEQELSRFYPKIKLYEYVGSNRKIDFEHYDLVLTTYAIVRRDIKKLKKIPFDVIVFDEAQAVKNVYADTTGAVRQLNAIFKLVMSGTPLENHLGEYYSLVDLCLPGLLGEYDLFKSQVKLDGSPMLPVLIQRSHPFVLRRVKEAVLHDLPPKIETDLYLDLTDRQKQLYRETVSLISSKIDTAYKEKTAAQAKIIALTAILKLRQLCVSTRLIDSEATAKDQHSPKISFLVEQLQELCGEGHSALVFSQFTSGLDLLEEALNEAKLPYCRLDGSTPTQKRKKLVKTFQESESPLIFLLSLKAGGQGLNLTRASYVFHLDPWWNPAVENQASDRVHRIGQTQHVSITRLLMRHTIEEKMMLLKKKKSMLYDAVMTGSQQTQGSVSISKSDFDFLLSSL